MSNGYATCPKSHRQLAEATAGKAYGHVPGHRYHDVDVVISCRSARYRCEAVETWGSAQGHDEEHGRRTVVGYGDTVAEACRDAETRGRRVGMDAGYLTQAFSVAGSEAAEAANPPLYRAYDIVTEWAGPQ